MLPFVLLTLAAAPAVKPISGPEILGHVRFLASDLLEGRAPGSTGDRLAQEYLATQFESLGLEPGAPDGGYLQPFDIVGVTGDPKAMLVDAPKTSMTFKVNDDFIAYSGHQLPTSTLEKAPLVFVGYGIQAPEYQWDDFKGLDVKGKVIVVMNNDPEDDPRLFAGKARLWYGRWDYKYEQAAKLGAAGCLIIHTTPSAGYPWNVVVSSWTGEQFELPATPGVNTLQMRGFLTEDAARKVFALTGKNLDALRKQANVRGFKPVELGTSLSMTFSNVVARKKTANVLGLLRGSDPTLKSEVVVLTAHHDHLGKKDNAAPGEDTIFNGAVDNASGVGAMLAIARWFSEQGTAPKRSVLFAAVAGEEAGLLGSQYLIEHPPVPPAKMAADVNIDGLNFLGRTRDVSVIGLGKSSIDSVIAQYAKAQNRVVKPDALSDRGFFYRSDQFNFARHGVPSAYFSSGQDFIGRPVGWGKAQRERWEEKHYHQPSDEVRSDWDLSGAVEDTQLYGDIAWHLANAPQMPVWSKGDEFEAIRLQSLP